MSETLEEKLKRIADEAWEGTAEKQKLLVNRTFRLDSVELVAFTDAKGNDAEAHVATIILDGDEEPRNFWLGGRLVMPQVAAMVEDGNLPVRLSLIEDPDLKGSPYRLIPASNAAAPVVRPVSKHPEMDALVEFCRANKMTTASGAVDSHAVLEELDVSVGEGEKPADVFYAYCQTIKDEKGCDEDATYKYVLENLVVAMGQETEPESVPFE